MKGVDGEPLKEWGRENCAMGDVKLALFPAKEPERVSIELSYPEIPSKAA
jgi:hypothetical protein